MDNSKQEVGRTPGPWRVTGGTIIKEDCRPISESGVLIGSACGYPGSAFFPTEEEAVANAAFIVRACNSHDALVTLLKAADNKLQAMLQYHSGPAEAAIHGLRENIATTLAAAGAA